MYIENDNIYLSDMNVTKYIVNKFEEDITEQSNKESAYLIIHGFAGSTREIEYLENYLCKRGLNTHTFLLAGHGGTKKDLSSTSCINWIDSAVKVVEKLSLTYKKINIIGFSMGGLICVHLASLPKIGKIVFINTPIYFWNIKVILNGIVDDIRKKQTKNISYYKRSVSGVSIKSCIDFLNILSKSKKILKNVQNISLILQCKNDESVHFKSAEYLKRGLGGKTELCYYNGGCHQVFLKSAELRDSVCEKIYRFLIT